MFWEDIIKNKTLLDIRDPILPRRPKLLKKFDKPENYHFPSATKYFFKNTYFDVYDQTINCIRGRFDHLEYQIYVNLQESILKAFNRKDFTDELKRVINLKNLI